MKQLNGTAATYTYFGQLRIKKVVGTTVEIPDGGGGFGGSEQASKAFSKAMAKQCDPKDVKK